MKDTLIYSKFRLNFKGNLREFSHPIVMGILNVTPDSFYKESRHTDGHSLLQTASKMIAEGAQILDIGGYSSRPGASFVTEEEEIRRAIPAIEALHEAFPDVLLSIDTFRSSVAEQAIKSGASIINDISGGKQDEAIFKVAAKYQSPYILMHMRGTPEDMQTLTDYDDLILDINRYFNEQISVARSYGVKDIIIDPGFGFSKTIDQNYTLLEQLESLKLASCPIMVGLSRKSMIYKKLGVAPEDSLEGTISANEIALRNGASILRVHDVKEAVQVIHQLQH